MDLRKTQHGEILVLAPSAARLDAANAVRFKDEAAKEIEGGARRIVLDLSAVDFMDSSGLGAVVALLKRVGREGEIVLAGVKPAVKRLLEVTRMDRILAQCADTQAAIARMNGARP